MLNDICVQLYIVIVRERIANIEQAVDYVNAFRFIKHKRNIVECCMQILYADTQATIH